MSLLAWLVLCSFLISLIIVFFLTRYLNNIKKSAHQFEIKQIEIKNKIQEAQIQAEAVIKQAMREAKDIAYKKNQEFERYKAEKNQEYQKIEEKLKKQELALAIKSKSLEKKDAEIKAKEALISNEYKKVSEQAKQIEQATNEHHRKLESIAKLTMEEARDHLKQMIEDDAKEAAMLEVQKIEAEAKVTAQERARSILATSIQRIAGEFVADATVSVIALPNDEMKGRIIGREGRNIRAIEQATGVDVIIDDTPEAIIISCFNPIRREIAKLAIERLVADGRIHPARIQETVEKTQAEIESDIHDVGERAAFDCGITGLSSELAIALGRLKYMTTGGQSVLQHSIETVQIGTILANELGINPQKVQRAALFHDIGKSLPETTEGSHSQVGADFLQKHGESEEIIEAALRHDDDNLQNAFISTIIVQAANNLSRFRPGARKDFIQRAIKRLSDIEKSVETFKGVEQAYIVKSGKELRAMILPSMYHDGSVYSLAKTIAKRLRQESTQNSGNVKVTLIREQKAISLAK